jgi:ABC-type lipoprotein release transport system permease subunit
MLLSLAWRNIWRNKRRSLIIVSAIAVGLLCGLFASAVMFGMADSLLNSTIDRDLGHIQIHTKQFEAEKLIADTIPNALQIMDIVRNQNNVVGIASRVVIEGMGSSATTSNGVRIVGIDPQKEKIVTKIYKQIEAGSYFENDTSVSARRTNQIVIGQKLADNLGIKDRSKIVLSFQGLDGSIIYGAFRVTGIFKTESSTFDKFNVFVREDDLFSLLNSKPIYHEIVVRLSSVQYVDSVYSAIKTGLANFDPSQKLSVKNWKELAPDLKLMDEMTGMQLTIFLGIILFALLFGITNTMLMSVMERVREFGVLMAIGMKRSRVFAMIILETISLSLFGGILGMIMASILIAYFRNAGIDLSSFAEGFNEWNLSPVLQPILPAVFYLTITLMIVATAILSAIYPAIKAIRLIPARAIRTY